MAQAYKMDVEEVSYHSEYYNGPVQETRVINRMPNRAAGDLVPHLTEAKTGLQESLQKASSA